jgi:ABC-type phosphate transport system substrate-binding protein
MCRHRALALKRAALFALAAVTLASTTGCGRLDKDAVSTELKTLESSTAEGMLVAQEAAQNRAPADFIEIRSAELSKQSENTAKTLVETPTESGLQQAASRGADIGNRAAEILDALHGDPADDSLAKNVATELDSLRQEAGRLEESL